MIKMKRWKEIVITAASTVMMLPTTVFANSDSIQKAIQNANQAELSSIDDFFKALASSANGLIPIVATVALLVGILISLAASPFKKYRGMGVAAVVFVFGLLVLLWMLPELISLFSGGK